ncbi:ricin B lectin domain-containing protein [Panaeolus papilionaceus]|nr:ricin B lectin domain-containing protein [Panaeolus papilionaceus]
MPSMLLWSTVVLSVTSTVLGQVFPKTYTIVNNCPSAIDVYLGTTLEGNLASGASKTTFVGPNAGYFYTTANGGQATKSTRVAFFDDDNGRNIYYIVKDVDNFNVGVSVTPNNHPVTNGFCGPATCNDVLCNAAFPGPPTHSFPPNEPTAPNPPLFRCTFPDVTYTITFCPSGAFPTHAQLGRPINPNFNRNKCLDVRGAVYANGTPVQIYDCNNTGAQRWVIKRGSTKVQVAGTNFCLDAGSSPASGVGMKIWQCYDNLAAQQWSFTTDNKIALATQGQCLDLPNGVLTNSNQVQTWQCSNNNNNQIWTALTT